MCLKNFFSVTLLLSYSLWPHLSASCNPEDIEDIATAIRTIPAITESTLRTQFSYLGKNTSPCIRQAIESMSKAGQPIPASLQKLLPAPLKKFDESKITEIKEHLDSGISKVELEAMGYKKEDIEEAGRQREGKIETKPIKPSTTKIDETKIK